MLIRDQDDATGGADTSSPRHRRVTNRHLLPAVAAAVVASLTSIFLLGHSLGVSFQDDSRPVTNQGLVTDPTGMATSAADPTGAGDPAAMSTASAAAPGIPGAGPTPAGGTQAPNADTDPGRALPVADGPFGSLQTTGTDQVALTLDDGPDPNYTPQALKVLRQHGVKATFCLIGSRAQEYPELVRAIVADGHTLCNHSWSHDMELGSRSTAAILADLTRTNRAILAAAPNAQVRYFRQPGGMWTSRVVATARQLGMTSLHWAVDPQDWREPSPEQITSQVLDETAAGSIVLLHDGGGNRQNTITALTPILSDLTSRFRLGALPASGFAPPR